MLEMLDFIVQCLDREQDLVLATVVQKQGSAPREAGAKMVLRKGALQMGSVGGGPLEAQSMARAAELEGSGQAQVVEILMTNQDASLEGMVCGGRVKVLIESLLPNRHNRETYCAALDCLRAGERGWLGCRLPGDSSRPQAGTERFFTKLPPEAAPPQALSLFPPEMVKCAPQDPKPAFWQGSQAAYWLEPITPESCLFIYGGGHVGRAVASLAKQCGFKVVVLDDREEFANPRQHPDADETRVISHYGRAVDLDEIGPQSYIAIMTRGHLHDYEVLTVALKSRAAYIGLMGSRRKSAALVQRLQTDGFRAEGIGRIHTPIGLDIGAQTPAELAVSIVGQLIAARAGK